MTIFTKIMMLGWFPITIILYFTLGLRRAAPAALILGWLFLPGAVFNFHGLPDYNKIVAVCFPIIISTMLFEPGMLQKLKPTKLDIPIIAFCFCGIASSLSNRLGIYDGISGLLNLSLTYGLPYMIGKMYFSEDQALRNLAMWVVIGGLIYAPLCIWEMRMSPSLHSHIYGFRQDSFYTTSRLGGYRPVVFLQNGMALGVWMMSAALMSICLWRSKCFEYLMGLPAKINVAILLVVFILCRSLNSILLSLVGIFVLYGIWTWRRKIFILLLALAPVFYICARNTSILSTETLVSYASVISEDRARSLYGRLYYEGLLIEKAKQQPFFGWGGWGRNRLHNEYGEDTSVTDGLWILIFGIYGYVGLFLLGMVLLMPTILFWKRYRSFDWKTPFFAPTIGFITILPLFTIDCLMNAFLNPVFIVASGGVLGWMSKVENDPKQLSNATKIVK